jgi:type II secretory pathway component PulJ
MRRYRQTGMSLLEVLVAFAILALVLGVIMQIFSSGMRASRLGESYSKAVLLAEFRSSRLTMAACLKMPMPWACPCCEWRSNGAMVTSKSAWR